MEHLALEVFDLEGTGSKFATLPSNTTIHIRRTSQIFGNGAVFTQEFTLNIPNNAHLFGTAGDIHGSRLHEQINKRKARIWAEGAPLYLGYLRLADEVDVDVDGNVDVTFESGQKTFEEMIEGAKANQVPLMGDVQIGMALWRKRWTKYRVKLQASLPGKQISQDGIMRFINFSGPVTKNGSEWFEFSYDGESEDNSTQQYPRMVFPGGSFTDYGHENPDEEASHINTDYPYDDAHPYCNVALCYQKSGYKKKNPDGSIYDDYTSEPEAQRGYEVMPANRVNSAPNFFVIYWIRALMKHLNIYIDENQMMDVEDLRRLFFVNTNVAYEEPKNLTGTNRTRYGKYYHFPWSERMIPEYIDSEKNINRDESGFVGKNVQIVSGDIPTDVSLDDKVSVVITDIEAWSDGDKDNYVKNNSFFHKAFATSECFPDVDISEVISALESGFGVRLLFSEDYQRVRIVLLRNIFRSQEVQTIKCDIIGEPTKTENSIRGFRMTYGDSEDTLFYYKGFADKLPHKKELWVDNSDKHDYSQWDLSADYGKLIHKVSAFDKTCYVIPDTGNAHIIKVDKDAKRYDELHPSLFGCADFMDAEDGDCTGDDETIETINVGFKPAIMNDVNFEQERDEGTTDQRFALFVDETMRPRRPDLQDGQDYNDPTTIYDVDKLYAQHGPSSDSKMTGGDGIVKPGEFAIRSDMYASLNGAEAEMEGRLIITMATATIKFDIDGHINEGCRLYLQDNYEPNDDGICPVETKDWGLTLGIMRGSGSDAYVNYTHDPDDGEGNDTWGIMAGSSATSHPDTCDNYGNEWDYNGTRRITTSQDAAALLQELFADSNAAFYVEGFDGGYINHASITTVADDNGKEHRILIATQRGSYPIDFGQNYIPSWVGHSTAEIMAMDAEDKCIIVEMDSSEEHRQTLLDLCKWAYGNYSGHPDIIIDNGVGSRYGRFSLKLRAEKLNPYFDPKQAESSSNRRYLEITNDNLKGRGLIDQFYKEYSKFVREARIVNLPVRMELAQLLTIDDTVRATVGDVTGFIKEMEYDISNETGLGNVTIQMMYI